MTPKPPTFTQKHYEALARIIGRLSVGINRTGPSVLKASITDQFVQALAKDNERFDPVRFRTAVGKATSKREIS